MAAWRPALAYDFLHLRMPHSELRTNRQNRLSSLPWQAESPWSPAASSTLMAFKVRDLVAFLSTIMTLEPGDVIITGTPPEAGLLQVGEVVEVTVGSAGTLSNRVVAG